MENGSLVIYMALARSVHPIINSLVKWAFRMDIYMPGVDIALEMYRLLR